MSSSTPDPTADVEKIETRGKATLGELATNHVFTNPRRTEQPSAARVPAYFTNPVWNINRRIALPSNTYLHPPYGASPNSLPPIRDVLALPSNNLHQFWGAGRILLPSLREVWANVEVLPPPLLPAHDILIDPLERLSIVPIETLDPIARDTIRNLSILAFARWFKADNQTRDWVYQEVHQRVPVESPIDVEAVSTVVNATVARCQHELYNQTRSYLLHVVKCLPQFLREQEPFTLGYYKHCFDEAAFLHVLQPLGEVLDLKKCWLSNKQNLRYFYRTAWFQTVRIIFNHLKRCLTAWYDHGMAEEMKQMIYQVVGPNALWTELASLANSKICESLDFGSIPIKEGLLN
ncbi:hypothetical protein EDC01DRAFT_636254 [Geopyxis carbonaria]|nr:hypothetical protein EDC01DRAFT_636254 [Geopyxis carbonaria]